MNLKEVERLIHLQGCNQMNQMSKVVVCLKQDIDSLLRRVQQDNLKILKENYEMSKAIEALEIKLDNHIEVLK